MPSKLARFHGDQIRALLACGVLRDTQRASIAGCSTRTIRRARSRQLNAHASSRRTPSAKLGRPRLITPNMMRALCDKVLEQPDMYLDEMALFIWDQFQTKVTTASISRAMATNRWSNKLTRRVAQERNTDLRDFYLYTISHYHSSHLVYIDESGLNRLGGMRRKGWSPFGVTPVHVAPFRRGRRHQIIAALAQDGILHYSMAQGSTDHDVFEEFIEQLVQYCGRWPAPKSVLVMDNASFHHTDRIKTICDEAGVHLVYLPPYSPDLNPIEEFFAELKTFARRHWQALASLPYVDFGSFVEWCVQMVGTKETSARGHFRHAGIFLEDSGAN